MGKKDTNTDSLSFDDRRNLMSGARTNGPTLSIAGGTSASVQDNNRNTMTVGTVSFNNNGSMNIKNDNVSIMIRCDQI